MREWLQPYLPELSIKDLPYKGHEFLTAQKEDGDYYIALTPAGVLKACTRQKPFGLPSDAYEAIFTTVESDEPTREIVEVRATRDSQVLSDYCGIQGFVFRRDRFGPVVLIYPPLLASLMEGSIPHLMTRYDGHTNKIWIRMQDCY